MKLKRISRGFYHAPEANKWITVCLDEKRITWHIYEDEHCRSEYWMDFPSLRAAREALESEKKK